MKIIYDMINFIVMCGAGKALKQVFMHLLVFYTFGMSHYQKLKERRPTDVNYELGITKITSPLNLKGVLNKVYRRFI